MTNKQRDRKILPEFVICPECGNEQTDMGRGVQCEECGYGPMPSPSQVNGGDK